MPILMPTPQEMQRLSQSHRQRVRRAVVHIMREAELVAARELRRAESAREFGERVREQARALEQQLVPEPESITRARQQALLNAIR